MAGPLSGVKILEIAGIGPGPFCAMLLADMGADVLRIQRPQPAAAGNPNMVVGRGMRSMELDLKIPEARDTVLNLLQESDALIEGFRPGVMERLGLGPDDCMAHNPKLVYGRMTGWGQHGPLSHTAGHDINYIAITGALAAIGTRESGPLPPLNLLGDFGGGGMLLAFGMVCALLEAGKSGNGQVVDAAMSDGASLLMATTYGYLGADRWKVQRESNLLDGAAHFYTTYRCADDRWVAVGAIEPQFYCAWLQAMGLDVAEFSPQHDESKWPHWKARLANIFSSKTRDAWCAQMEGVDACFSPVLDMTEAPLHPHNAARQTFVNNEGVLQPAPAPRFSRTQPEIRARRTATAHDEVSGKSEHAPNVADTVVASA